MIEEWIYIDEVDELSKIGNFNYVRNLIKKDLEEFRVMNFEYEIDMMKILNITSNSREGLVKKIRILRSFIKSQSKESIVQSSYVLDDNHYFKSSSHEIIYYLLELDGKERMKKLDVAEAYYYDKEMAKIWYHELAKKIHPDRVSNLDTDIATKAMSALTAIYDRMSKGGK